MKENNSSNEAIFIAAIESIKVVAGMILLDMAKYGEGSRDTIIKNFISRGIKCLESILLVWQNGSNQDAWILHRTLLDRLFHLHHLAKNNDFTTFEEFSFMKLFEARERLLADEKINYKVPPTLKELQASHREKYKQLRSKNFKWQRPDAEKVAKAMNLNILYKYGYDYASMHVHPMSFDGEDDFWGLTSAYQKSQKGDDTVINNSILVCTVLLQESLNHSDLNWRRIVYNFLDDIRLFVQEGKTDFSVTVQKIVSIWPNDSLCGK